MQLYLYSSQDMVFESKTIIGYKANTFCRLQFQADEIVKAYSLQSADCMFVDYGILSNNQHSQIVCHTLNPNALLCEIKPFINGGLPTTVAINNNKVKLIQNSNDVIVYYNNQYYAYFKNTTNIRYEKIKKNNNEYGLVYISGVKKYIVLFDEFDIIYCGQYIDVEVLKSFIQIYAHNVNMFNVGTLLKYNFSNKQMEYKSVCDRGVEKKIANEKFIIILFLEALKCQRYKLAYNQLSYELRSEVDKGTLIKYFRLFDEYYYLSEQNCYITLFNHKIVGVYHFEIKENMIFNIY